VQREQRLSSIGWLGRATQLEDLKVSSSSGEECEVRPGRTGTR
jgi:hypothetical protein